MDCREAQHILDAAHVDARDLWEPDIAPAAVHLESCRDCQQTFKRKNRFDHAFGAAVLDVAVPAGLTERLLAAISAASGDLLPDNTTQTLEAPPPQQQVGRSETEAEQATQPRRVRRGTWWMSTAALVLIAAVGVFSFWPTGRTPVPLNQLLAEFVVQGQYQTPFDGNFAAKLPAEGWDSKRLRIEGPFGYAATNAGIDQAAVYRFLLASRRQSISGKLVVIPASRVTDQPPPSTIFEVTAESSSDGSYSHAAWTEGDFVYVCFVDGHAGRFSTLQQALAPRLG